jgi:hypothetical protein
MATRLRAIGQEHQANELPPSIKKYGVDLVWKLIARNENWARLGFYG